MGSNFEDKIKTSKEERLNTGLDLTGKKVFTNKEQLFDVFIKAYGVIMDYGANKYAYANFEKAPYVYRDVLDCLMRHAIAYSKGECVDPESSQLHLGHIVARGAIAAMKASRKVNEGMPDAERFIGWDDNDLEQLLNIVPGLFKPEEYSSLKPKNIPFTTHVTIEMFDAVSESPFFSIRDNYSLESWFKTFQTCLISFICSNINGETEEDEILHAKVLLWLAINIYYHESKLKKDFHPGYYKG